MNSGWFMAAFGCIDKESPTCTPIQFIVGFIYTKDFGTEVFFWFFVFYKWNERFNNLIYIEMFWSLDIVRKLIKNLLQIKKHYEIFQTVIKESFNKNLLEARTINVQKPLIDVDSL